MRKHAFPVVIGTEFHFAEGASRIADVIDDPFGGTTVELEDMPFPGAMPARSFSMPITLLAAIVDAYDAVVVLPHGAAGFDEAA